MELTLAAIARPQARPSVFFSTAWLAGLANALPLAALASMAGFFGWWYGRYLFRLPIFGDAAEHAYISRQFLDKGFLHTASPYPPLYHLLGAVGLEIGGDKGFIAVTLASIVALGVGVYFLATEVTSSRAVGLTAALIAYVSPKTVFYGGRLYMEVFLTVLFVFAFFFLHRYLRTGGRADLLRCALVSALAAVTKQQGLLLLALPLCVFLPAYQLISARRTRRRLPLAELIAFPAVIALFALPATAWQVRNTGGFLPDSDYTSGVNSVARSVLGYHDATPAWQLKWDDYLDEQFIGGGHLAQGSVQAETRHVWPLQAVTTKRGFFSIQSLMWSETPGGIALPSLESGILDGLLVLGLVLWFWTHRPVSFAIFLVGFLALNYLTFVRNNDQMRYHLFISYIVAFTMPFAIYYVFSRRSALLATFATLGLAVVLCAFASRYLPQRTESLNWYWNSQAYAPSAGGIRSIQQVSAFIDESTKPGASFYAIPSNEFAYYSQRDAVFDNRLFFLSSEDLRAVFADMQASYIVIPASATLPDANWNHLAKAPQSFVDKVAALYPLAFTSAAGDIRVFKVQ